MVGMGAQYRAAAGGATALRDAWHTHLWVQYPYRVRLFRRRRKTIMNAIQEQKLDSVEAIGTCLKAGAGCGSCVPEIRRILERC